MHDLVSSETRSPSVRELLEGHIAVNETLSSNALNAAAAGEGYIAFPKGYRHFDLKTLSQCGLGVDILRYGGVILMLVGEMAVVRDQDLVASDRVDHLVDRFVLSAADCKR